MIAGGRSSIYSCTHTGWGSTTAPLTTAALQILQGVITDRGVVPPEAGVEPLLFFRAIANASGDRDRRLLVESVSHS